MMLLTLIQELSSPNIRFIFQPSAIKDGYDFYAPLKLYPKAHISLKGFDMSFLFRLLPPRLIKRYGLYFDSDIDVVLDASGFALSDQWGIAPANNLLSSLLTWEKNGVKVILLPQAFGPFKKKKLKNLMTKIITRVDKIYARDQISINYLKDLKKDYENKIEKYPDFTCLLKGKVPSYFNKVMHQVCIVPNYRMIDKTEFEEDYYSILCKFIKKIQDKNLNPFFLIHGGNEDLKVAKSINNMLSKEIEIIQEKDPILIKGIISNSLAILGSRYHSLVSGLCSAVPTYGIGWSHKYECLFEEHKFKSGLIDFSISDEIYDEIVNSISSKLELKKIKDQLKISKKENEKLAKKLFKDIKLSLKELENKK